MLKIIANDAVPRDEVWIAQPIARELRESVTPSRDLLLQIVTTYQRVGRIVNVAPAK